MAIVPCAPGSRSPIAGSPADQLFHRRSPTQSSVLLLRRMVSPTHREILLTHREAPRSLKPERILPHLHFLYFGFSLSASFPSPISYRTIFLYCAFYLRFLLLDYTEVFACGLILLLVSRVGWAYGLIFFYPRRRNLSMIARSRALREAFGYDPHH